VIESMTPAAIYEGPLAVVDAAAPSDPMEIAVSRPNLT
jgi:hypothetical protein